MTTTKAGASVATHCVDLVNEDQAGRVLLPLFEQVADARRANTDEHLHEVGSGHREERASRFAGDGARQERLARSWRSDEQHALWEPTAQTLKLLRITQKLDDLFELHLRLVASGYVLERHLRRVARK